MLAMSRFWFSPASLLLSHFILSVFVLFVSNYSTEQYYSLSVCACFFLSRWFVDSKQLQANIFAMELINDFPFIFELSWISFYPYCMLCVCVLNTGENLHWNIVIHQQFKWISLVFQFSHYNGNITRTNGISFYIPSLIVMLTGRRFSLKLKPLFVNSNALAMKYLKWKFPTRGTQIFSLKIII